MAEVTFIGGGNNGFPSTDTQILPANGAQSAEVSLIPSGNAPGELSTQVELVANAPIDAEVDYFVDPQNPPASENPNDNDLIYVVVGGPTSGALGVNVQLVKASILEGETIVEQGYITDDLTLFAGPLGPSGLLGKEVIFIQPTGASAPSPIKGITGTIGAIYTTPIGVGSLGVGLEFTAPITPQPTNGDRFIVRSDDRTLRRTPVIEIILE